MAKSDDRYIKGKYVIIENGKGNVTDEAEIEARIKTFIEVRTKMTGNAPTQEEIKKKRRQIKKELE